ncbi:MAG TPA: hypothetical protein VFV99_30165 [Kofleriaceae bacterium]|nr:hypothetical protein [Kofleriaceae bacterium]
MSSLRTAIDDADRQNRGRTRRIGGLAFNALQAAIHDLRDELVACAKAADPSVRASRYRMHVVIDGHISVGAVVEDVSVKRLVTSGPDQPPTEVATSAQACIERLLMSIELPRSDGPGDFETVLETDRRCVDSAAHR